MKISNDQFQDLSQHKNSQPNKAKTSKFKIRLKICQIKEFKK